MSLHDIDKTHSRRLRPTPNSSDQIRQRYAHGTVQHQNSGEEAIADGLKFLERQVVAVQDGFKKAIFGFFGTANKFGLKVAKDGYDADDPDDSNLIFNSEQNVFKIAVSTTASQLLSNTANVVPQGLQTFTIPHNLGIIPAFIVYMTAPSSFIDGGILFMLPHVTYSNSPSAGSVFTIFYATADINNIYIKYNHRANTDYSPNSPIFDIRCYILQETSN